MPDELYVPQSEPLKRLFRNPTRSKYMTWYLWFSLIFHSFVLIRAWYIITQMAYPLARWRKESLLLILFSIILLLLCGLNLLGLRKAYGWIVYLLSLVYIPMLIYDMPDIMESSQDHSQLLFFGNNIMIFRLMLAFMLIHIIVVPIYTVVQLIRRFKNRSH